MRSSRRSISEGRSNSVVVATVAVGVRMRSAGAALGFAGVALRATGLAAGFFATGLRAAGFAATAFRLGAAFALIVRFTDGFARRALGAGLRTAVFLAFFGLETFFFFFFAPLRAPRVFDAPDLRADARLPTLALPVLRFLLVAM